jgi:ABC-type multidrug transport system permease subunit
MSSCKVCSFENASDYLKTLYLEEYSYGWRDAGIVVLMVFSSYGLVYALMKLRTKTSKTAE